MYGLTNEQIVFIYLSLRTVNDRYEEVFGKGQITQMVLGMGNTLVSSKLQDEIINDLKKSEHYKMLAETVIALQPIFELIQDVEPEMVDRIKEVFKP
jgi:hypothetical protein